VEAPEPRAFYRVVESDPPTLRDFMSYEALGKPLRKPRPTPAELASWRAVSTYITEEAARARALENHQLGFPIGDFIARVVLLRDAPVTWGPINSKGHCDLTGDPAALLAAVVLPVVKV
jgi:hypothetical protein